MAAPESEEAASTDEHLFILGISCRQRSAYFPRSMPILAMMADTQCRRVSAPATRHRQNWPHRGRPPNNARRQQMSAPPTADNKRS